MGLRGGSSALVAEIAEPIVRDLLGGLPEAVALRWWDGSITGPDEARTSIHVHSPRVLRRLVYAPGELGLARAYVAGEIDVEGDIFDVLELRTMLGDRRDAVKVELSNRARLRLILAAIKLGALGGPLPRPPEEARLRGGRHSKRRDAQAIGHHYDVSNDFYRLVLGPSMTYSCAYFPEPSMTLEEAQAAKHELICRKLGLTKGLRLLDVGCGWGGMALHAAEHHGVEVVGITISKAQAELAEKRVSEAGLSHQVEIRLQDYRDVDDGPFDSISSIGMFEHVGVGRLGEYFGSLGRLLRSRGRFLNHAISRPGGEAAFEPTSFIARYVFPDGELQEVGAVVSAMQSHGFEVRDVESLREHYARTLRSWVSNLEGSWADACRYARESKARIWRLYMVGSATAFEAGRINVHQVLGVRLDDSGASGMPATRRSFA